MKNLFIISIITIISVFVSCKKDKEDENTPVAEKRQE